METLVLPPLATCPVAAPACEPVDCSPAALGRSVQSMCQRVNALEQEFSTILAVRPDESLVSMLIRRMNAAEAGVAQLRASAITCLSWNPETCQIQGLTLGGTLKVFPKDPCLAALEDRVQTLEASDAAFSNLTALTNQVNALESKTNLSVKTISAGSGTSLSYETQAGTVLSVDIAPITPKSSTLLQETNTAGPAVLFIDIPFIVAIESNVEIFACFSDATATDVYDIDVRNSVPVVVQTFDSPTTGVVISDADLHQVRVCNCHLAPGNYNVRVRENGAGTLNSLKVSLQINSIP